MEKVLLAIEGLAPDRSTFSYALALCKRMRADLDILQILSPRSYGKYLKKVKKGVRHARNVFENAMVAVTFAEAGQHDIAEQIKKQAYDNLYHLIPEPERDGISYHLTLKSGNPGEEIVRYVCDHRDVVLTIYDASGVKNEQECLPGGKKDGIPQIAEKLPTPLVLKKGCNPAGPKPRQGGTF